MSVHHEFDVSTYYTPEQNRNRRRFLARFAIQQWWKWEKHPDIIEGSSIEDKFDTLEGLFQLGRPANMLNRDMDEAHDLFLSIRNGASRNDLDLGDLKPATRHVHLLNKLHLALGGVVKDYDRLTARKGVYPEPLPFEDQPSQIREVSRDVALLEPHRSIFIAKTLDWDDEDISEAFGNLRTGQVRGSDYDSYEPARIISTFLPKLHNKLTPYHPDLGRFQQSSDEDDEFTKVPPYVLAGVMPKTELAPGENVQRFLAAMVDCRDELIPKLRKEHLYTGPLPISKIRATCFKSPNNYKEKIGEWFDGSLRVINKLQLYGSLAPHTNITQHLIQNYRRYIEELSTIDRSTLKDDYIAPDHEGLSAIRAYYSTADNTFSGKYGWETSLLAYAVKKYYADKKLSISDDEAMKAAVYTATGQSALKDDIPVPTQNNQEEEQWISKLGVTLAYIEDVRALQGQDVPNPLAVARYHDRNVVNDLFNKYAPSYLSKEIILHCLRKNPRNTEARIIALLDERAKLSEIMEEQGYAIDIDTLTYLANQHPLGAEEKAAEFLNIYPHLVDAHMGTDHFEEWMAARSIVRYPDNPNLGVKFYIRLARTGFFEENSTRTSRRGRNQTASLVDRFEEVDLTKIADHPHESTQDNIEGILQDILSPTEREALYVIFKFPQGEYINEGQVAEKLGANDLERYVMETIIPKLRSSHISLSDFV